MPKKGIETPSVFSPLLFPAAFVCKLLARLAFLQEGVVEDLPTSPEEGRGGDEEHLDQENTSYALPTYTQYHGPSLNLLLVQGPPPQD